jgi:DNA-binding CsgD family transcriptional regulator
MKRNHKLVIGAAAVAAVAGGSAAIAASGSSSPSQESQAIINDTAQRLGIAPTKLSAALRQALIDRVDAAVAAGRITNAQGDALKQRINSNDFPLIGGGHRDFGHFGFFGRLDAAASYLGLTEAQLHSELASGKTLAQIAKDHGKSADGLVNALVNAAKQKLDAAVKAGRLTQSQADQMLSDLQSRITDLVNGKLPAPGGDGLRRPPGFRPGFRHFFGPSA